MTRVPDPLPPPGPGRPWIQALLMVLLAGAAVYLEDGRLTTEEPGEHDKHCRMHPGA